MHRNSQFFHRVLHAEDVIKFLSWNPADAGSVAFRDSVLISLLLQTGLRRAEAAALSINDFSRFGDNLWISFIGKGSRIRKVPISHALEHQLLKLWKNQGLDPSLPAFQSTKTGTFMVPQNVHLIVTGRSEQILGFRISAHVLRHTAATMWLKNGVDLKTVQTLLGHSNIATTSRYLHTSSDELVAAVEKTSNLFTGAPVLQLFPKQKEISFGNFKETAS